MLPVNYAILKYFTKVDEGSADDVIEALKDKYGKSRLLKKNAVVEALMTAEKNFILEETRFELDENNEIKIYYKAPEDGKATINNYIKEK